MKRLMQRSLVAILAFGFGVAVDRVLIAKSPHQPQVQEPVAAPPVEVPAVPVSTPAPSPAEVHLCDFDPQEFDPAGDYYIVGTKPKGFDSFNSIYLLWSDGQISDTSRLMASMNHTPDTQTVVFSLVTRRRVLIITEEQTGDGLAYMFDGEFLHNNFDGFANTTMPVLRGTLTKVKYGRKVAATVVSLRVEQHVGC